MGNYYGYNRVSTKEQHSDRGKESIEKFCRERGYKGKRTHNVRTLNNITERSNLYEHRNR